MNHYLFKRQAYFNEEYDKAFVVEYKTYLAEDEVCAWAMAREAIPSNNYAFLEEISIRLMGVAEVDKE
jgi:hypothetical protein